MKNIILSLTYSLALSIQSRLLCVYFHFRIMWKIYFKLVRARKIPVHRRKRSTGEVIIFEMNKKKKRKGRTNTHI